MTLLSIIQDAALNLGLSAPSLVIGSTDQQTQELLAALNNEGQALTRMTPILPQLIRRGSWTTLASDYQGPLETIMPGYRYLAHDTLWDRTMMWPIVGPLTPQQWEFLKARAVQGPNYSYRIMVDDTTNQNSLYLLPSPPAGETFYLEFVSKYWVSNAAGTTTYPKFSASDADIALIDEYMLQLGTEWRWLRIKGFENWKDRYQDYLAYRNSVFGQDSGSKAFGITGALPSGRIYYADVQDGNYPAN